MNKNAGLESTASRLLLEADAKAEQLLGIVRMVVSGSIAIALAIALNLPDRPDSEFLDKQGFLAAVGMASYFMVGLTAYLLVKKGHYRPWMAWITAFFDVILITLNVWLSINFSGLNSHYALTFPSALMIPLILTFGALRFRPYVQMFMTIMVCCLAGFIIFSNPYLDTSDADVITQMSLTHALPPNLIRIWLLFSTGTVIAIAVWRARGLLYRITKETEQRLNLTRFLPKTVVENLSDQAMLDLKKGRQLPLVMMFLDLRGFTRMSESMTPEATSVLLTEYRSHIIDVAEKYDGIVDKFIGDGALVIFGVSSTQTQAANAALEASVELNKRFEAWSSKRHNNGQARLDIGIGMHLGDVFVGAVGDNRRLEFTVLGDNVNIASRIEQMTKIENYYLLASEDLIAAADQFKEGWVQLGSKALRGHTEAIEIWSYKNSMKIQ